MITKPIHNGIDRDSSEINISESSYGIPNGQIIYQNSEFLTESQQINLNVSHFAKGLYYAVFEGKDTAFSGRFIVL